jgi:hypothetical protein
MLVGCTKKVVYVAWNLSLTLSSDKERELDGEELESDNAGPLPPHSNF